MCDRNAYLLGRYRYLVPRAGAESVFSAHGGRAGVLRRRLVVVWSHRSRAFYVFASVDALKGFLACVPASEQNYSEVVLAEQRQRPRLDLDGGDAAVYRRVVRALRRLVPDARLVVTDQSTPQRYSRHVLVDAFYPSMEATLPLVAAVRAALGADADVVDTNVYHSIQNFRLLGSSKGGGEPRKRLVTRGAALEDTLVGEY